MNAQSVFCPLRSSLLTLAIALSVASMAGAQQDTATARTDSSEGTLTDGQILQIVRVLNEAEIRQAELALDESGSDAVKEAAQLIVDDHTASNEQIEMMAEDDLELEDSITSESLEEMAEETREMLADLSGMEFDCAYLQTQVEMHQMALDTIGNELVPAAKNAQVRSFLTASTPKLEHHMHTARESREGMTQCG